MNTWPQKFSWSQFSSSDDIGMAVQINTSSLDRYLHEEIYASANQIVDENDRLRDIDKANYDAFAKSFSDFSYDYARTIMTVYHSSTVNPEGGTYKTTVSNIDCMKVPKKGHCWSMSAGGVVL